MDFGKFLEMAHSIKQSSCETDQRRGRMAAGDNPTDTGSSRENPTAVKDEESEQPTPGSIGTAQVAAVTDNFILA